MKRRVKFYMYLVYVIVALLLITVATTYNTTDDETLTEPETDEIS